MKMLGAFHAIVLKGSNVALTDCRYAIDDLMPQQG
jgi:hypothetical protein